MTIAPKGRSSRFVSVALAIACALTVVSFDAIAQSAPGATTESSQRERKPQTRKSMERVSVDPAKVRVGDGDTVDIDWGAGGHETIRILGIDTPETQNPDHNLPYGQSFGEEARGFAKGAFAAAQKVEVLRTPQLDPYGRTLGYVFLNGVNYSVLIVRARLAAETVSHYGDNGFPRESAEVLAAAKGAGPVPFEAPHLFRQRMREVSEAMRKGAAAK
jgi:endonuclease YncB( thermonuclease family)